MSHPDPDYAFPPNWKPSKTVKCGKWTLPPTLLMNGRKSSKVENGEKISSKKGFTCVVCGSDFIGREKANYHVFQKHYRELCELGGDAIPDEIKPDFSQPTWGKEFLKENMEMSNEDIEKAVNEIKTPSSHEKDDENEDIEKAVNEIKTPSTHEKDDDVVQTPATSRGITNTSSKSNPLFKKVNENSSRKRINRCKKCVNCLKIDCKSCKACKDMIKYGGPGTWKQSCLMRSKCINVQLKVEKKEIKTPKKVGRPKKLVKVNNKNENTIKVEEPIVVEDEIPPFQPRVFPLNDEDFNRMMKQDTLAGNNCVDGAKDENGNTKKMKKKDIPTPDWKTTEQKMMASHKDAHDLDNIKNTNNGKNDKVTMHGDDDDFEDTIDEVYILRHDRAAAALEDGLLDESGNDEGGVKIPNDRAAAAPEDGLLDESGVKIPNDRAAAAPEKRLQDESWNEQGVKIRQDISSAVLEGEKMGQSGDYSSILKAQET